MSKTRKQKKLIFYTGIGARKNGLHTVNQFMKATQSKNIKRVCKTYKKFGTGKNSHCPKAKNVNGWIKWLGAEVRYK
jgi:hypothetical protein